MSSIRTSSLVREVRHPLWTPQNYDGSSPILAGTETNAANDWQPLGVGKDPMVIGASPNTKTFKADAGSKFILSGFSKKDTIEDDTGDGDDAVQMRSRVFTVPGGRQASFIVPATWTWLAQFLATVYDDPYVTGKRPFDLRETRYAVAAAAGTVDLGAGYAAGYEGEIVATGIDDIAVGDLVSIDSSSPDVRRLEDLDRAHCRPPPSGCHRRQRRNRARGPVGPDGRRVAGRRMDGDQGSEGRADDRVGLDGLRCGVRVWARVMRYGRIGIKRRLRFWWTTGRHIPRTMWEFHLFTGALRTDDPELQRRHRRLFP